ncbi:GMC family oxidoreductase [Allokutzneria sp. NRRL B-24872]|uniref:GMC family oxidoreductase n=1 Tax=Allokutzneria sp. NRRL B-24872 TaxID=1137961 RepID=UPI001178306E|nr:GMC family oxidoreductase N-terminal domain-containing protein [Allokutzneria sp. NRRL B-24872]
MHVDVLIVGGGGAGCVMAARLSEDERITVGLLEAGPDYGPFDPERWPAELLNARSAARGHDWDLQAPPCCARARVIGGSSAHNGCWATLGASADYDAWSKYSDGAWDYEKLRPYLTSAIETLKVRPVPEEDQTRWHHAVIDAAGELGMRFLDDINAEDANEGIGWVPLNAVGATRWHTGFAYLDPARGRPNLRILPDSLAARLIIVGDRATGVVAVRDGKEYTVTADHVVLASGTYGTPPLLMRSGIGPERVLAELGAPVKLRLDGVGANLVDHSSLGLMLNPLDSLTQELPNAAESYFAQTVVKARSSEADEFWDIHIVPSAGPAEDAQGFYTGPLSAGLYVFVMSPRSRGTVRAASLDPVASPRIDHGFFTDAEGYDTKIILEGVELAHDFARTARLSGLTGLSPWTEEQRSTPEILAAASGYWHPVGTCAMGPADDPMAVAGADGKVHGLSNVYIGDASLMPVIPRANTHLTTVAVADRLSALLLEGALR